MLHSETLSRKQYDNYKSKQQRGLLSRLCSSFTQAWTRGLEHPYNPLGSLQPKDLSGGSYLLLAQPALGELLQGLVCPFAPEHGVWIRDQGTV